MLRIRPFKISDIDYLLNWLKEERLFKMWSADKFEYPLTTEQLEDYKDRYELDEFAWMFTALDGNGVPVGHFLMRKADYEKGSIHLGFIVIDPEKRDHGYGQEMVRLAVKYAFELLGVNKVTLGVFDSNPRAEHCYKKVGFITEAHNMDALHYKDEVWGLYCMAIEKSPERTQAGVI